VDVDRGTAGLRVLGDELGVGEGGEDGQHQSEGEGGPDRSAGLRGDGADERVDAGAQDVAEDEERQQAQSHDPPQRALELTGLAHLARTRAGWNRAWSCRRHAMSLFEAADPTPARGRLPRMRQEFTRGRQAR
jgi:hypothetical protein